MAVYHIGYPKSWYMLANTDRNVVTALESPVENALGGWSREASMLRMWQRVAQTSKGLGAVQVGGGGFWLGSYRTHLGHCRKGRCLGVD